MGVLNLFFIRGAIKTISQGLSKTRQISFVMWKRITYNVEEEKHKKLVTADKWLSKAERDIQINEVNKNTSFKRAWHNILMNPTVKSTGNTPSQSQKVTPSLKGQLN